jgi:transketolase
MRDVFSESLLEATQKDPRVYLLTGDHGYALFDLLRKHNPSHYLNAGVAEQNMVGVAAGMAKTGLIPVVYGLASFVPIRVLEQIKLDICFEKLQVILIGDGAGVVYSKLGVSHQCFEDIAAIRALPNIQIFSPSDDYEMKLCFDAALAHKGPSYIRVGKCDLGPVHSSYDFSKNPGIHEVIAPRGDAPVVFATGSMTKFAFNVIKKNFEGFGLYSVSQIKPFDDKAFLSFSSKTKTIFTLEEHSVLGGMGSVITEVTCAHLPKKVIRFGIDDKFSDKCGTYEYLMTEHGLDEAALVKKIRSQI